MKEVYNLDLKISEHIIAQNDYLLEAFDCPFCGCQNSVNTHYEEVKHDRQFRGNDE